MSLMMKAVKLAQLNQGGTFYQQQAMRVAKGDPGLFGFLGKAISGVGKVLGVNKQTVGTLRDTAVGMLTGGPAGAIMGAASNVWNTAKQPSTFAGAAAVNQMSLPGVGLTLPGLPSLPNMLGPGNNTQSQPTDWNDKPNPSGTPCAKGYHYNKTGYYSKRYGFVPAHSVCVKNRRRNPLNPKAASRAMARLSSAKKASSFLSRFSIKGGGCGCRGQR